MSVHVQDKQGGFTMASMLDGLLQVKKIQSMITAKKDISSVCIHSWVELYVEFSLKKKADAENIDNKDDKKLKSKST